MTNHLKVALLQLRAFDLSEHEYAWEEMLRRIDEAAASEPNLIVLPEASYPAYFLQSREAYEQAGVLSDTEVETELGNRARQHGCYIAAGLVVRESFAREPSGPNPNEHLQNASVLFAPDGSTAGLYAKSFLWHFDHQWFTPGRNFPVFSIGGTPTGLLVCADARLPEISRSLAVAGAELIVDSTAWVSWGRDASELSSPQIDYIMPTRAIENGVWIIAADKVGMEAGSLVYSGRSGVIDPNGTWVVQAPSDRPGIVTCTLELDRTWGPPIRRRPELYAGASTTSEDSRAAELARQPLVVEQSTSRIGAVALAPNPSAVDLMEQARILLRSLGAQETALAVLPDLAGDDALAVTDREFLPLFAELSSETDTLLIVQLTERENGRTFKTVNLLQGGALLATHRQTHLSEMELEAGFSAGDEQPPVVETRIGYTGLLGGSEGLVPELSRSLKLRGTELIAWSAGELSYPLRMLARTRAYENRSYFVAAGHTGDLGGAYIIDPTGVILGETLSGEQMATSSDINRGMARWNDMAPNTNPIRNRDPEAFHILFGESPDPTRD